jgi:hypothetical protein
MAALERYTERDEALRSSTSTTQAEVSPYYISHADLTGAGFAVGDELLLLILGKHQGSTANNEPMFQVGRGTGSYAARTDWPESLQRRQTAVASTSNNGPGSMPYHWMKKHTLAASEQLFFSLWTSANNGYHDNHSVIILNLSSLDSAFWEYAETAPSGDAPTSLTDGAQVTLGIGNWLILACTHWLSDSTSADAVMAIGDGTTDFEEVKTDADSTSEEYVLMTAHYEAIASGTKTFSARYRSDSANTHDCNYTAIFALDLNAFDDWSHADLSSSVDPSGTTYVESGSIAAHPATVTGDHMIIGWQRPVSYATSNNRPGARLQVANSDWPIASLWAGGYCDNSSQTRHSMLCAGIASLTAGTHLIDYDVNENGTAVDTAFNAGHLIAFSMELAGAAPEKRPPPLQIVVPRTVLDSYVL